MNYFKKDILLSFNLLTKLNKIIKLVKVTEKLKKSTFKTKENKHLCKQGVF